MTTETETTAGTDCGGTKFGFRQQNAEAGIPMCDGCAKRRAEEQAAQELVARTNYCKMFGHDFSIRADDAKNLVIHCSNRCSIDGNYKAVPR